MNTPPIILSIAGSDPSGGAGIQADIKAISALGGYAATAITAITVQNTRGVTKVNYLPPVVVSEQIKAIFNDLEVSAIKIGMTGQYDIVKAISYALIKRRDIPVVLDPVMVATGGRKLAESKAVDALRLFLLPQCKVATPNLLEASVLLGKEVRTTDDMKQAAIWPLLQATRKHWAVMAGPSALTILSPSIWPQSFSGSCSDFSSSPPM